MPCRREKHIFQWSQKENGYQREKIIFSNMPWQQEICRVDIEKKSWARLLLAGRVGGIGSNYWNVFFFGQR